MMKKMKGVVAMEAAPHVYEDPRARFRHQSLMQDYQDLQKETAITNERLEKTKLKKLTLMAEVRFLRRRYKYLMKNRFLNTQPVRGIEQPPKSELQSKKITKKIPKERKYSGKQAAMRPLALGFDLNQKERHYNENEAILRKPKPIFDLNQERTYNGKEASFQPIFDVNKKERLYSGKDTSMQNATPSFDLNQISKEAEELQGNCEPLRDELKKSLIRGATDEQQNDTKLSACRNIGNGSNRAGKRKISWQDQVALRV